MSKNSKKAQSNLPSSAGVANGERSRTKKTSVKKKSVAASTKSKGGTIVTRSKGSKSKGKKKKKESVSTTPTTSNKSPKEAAKEKPKETSIVVVTEIEKSKKKEIGFMSKISNDLLKSAREANEAMLAAKDKEVTMAILATKDETSEKKEEVENTEKSSDVPEENDGSQDEEKEGEHGDEPVCANNKTLEDKNFLKKNPDIRKLLMSVEDMLINYRNSDKDTMEKDNVAFQEEATIMLESAFENKKTSLMYQRYQKKWVKFALENKLNKDTDKNLLDQKLYQFFVGFGKQYAPSTLYVMYSCINHYFISNFGYKLNTMLRLQRYLKHNPSTYVCKKSKVFTSEQIDQILKHCAESNDHKEILTGVGVSLMYYGLLRVCDSRKIQKKDASHQDNGRIVIKFEHARKRRNAGLTYHVPSLYSKLFKK